MWSSIGRTTDQGRLDLPSSASVFPLGINVTVCFYCIRMLQRQNKIVWVSYALRLEEEWSTSEFKVFLSTRRRALFANWGNESAECVSDLPKGVQLTGGQIRIKGRMSCLWLTLYHLTSRSSSNVLVVTLFFFSWDTEFHFWNILTYRTLSLRIFRANCYVIHKAFSAVSVFLISEWQNFPSLCFRIEMQRETLSYLHSRLLKHWKSADLLTGFLPFAATSLLRSTRNVSVWGNVGLLNSPLPGSLLE